MRQTVTQKDSIEALHKNRNPLVQKAGLSLLLQNLIVVCRKMQLFLNIRNQKSEIIYFCVAANGWIGTMFVNNC